LGGGPDAVIGATVAPFAGELWRLRMEINWGNVAVRRALQLEMAVDWVTSFIVKLGVDDAGEG
jgi:hypothetical protein